MPPAKFCCKPRIPSKPFLFAFPHLNPNPTTQRIRSGANTPVHTQGNPREHTAREGEQEELKEERKLSKSRTALSFLFSPFVQRHPIHYGHSLLVSRTRRWETGRGHSQRKSVEHNVFRSNDGRWLFWLVTLGLLFFLLQLLSCSPSLPPLS